MLLDTHVSFEATLPLIYCPKTPPARPTNFLRMDCFMFYLILIMFNYLNLEYL